MTGCFGGAPVTSETSIWVWSNVPLDSLLKSYSWGYTLFPIIHTYIHIYKYIYIHTYVHTVHTWKFSKKLVPQLIIHHLNRTFHEINHPSVRVLPFYGNHRLMFNSCGDCGFYMINPIMNDRPIRINMYNIYIYTIFTYTHKHTYIYTHTHIRTYIYIYIM